MQKILLIRTDSRAIPRLVSPPLGLLYLASALRAWGGHPFDMEIFDMHLWRKPYKVLRRRLREFEPDLVGLSVLTFEAREMHRAAEMIKEYSSSCPVVVGGPHGTIFYSEILADPNIDYVVVGEGEKSFLELIDSLEAGGPVPEISGVAGRRGHEVVFPGTRKPLQDLDAIPFPAWDLIDIDKYRRFPDFNVGLGKGRYMGIFTSRACPYQCIYCHSIFGKGFRARSSENVLEEMDILRSRYGIKEFQVFDDCFNFRRDRVLAIAEGICRRGKKIRMSFPNGIRGDLLDREVLGALWRAGAYTFCVAVETASPRLQELIKKNLDLPKIKEAIAIADDIGYLVKGFFMFGFPTETKEEMRLTLKFACETPLYAAAFFTVVPFAKTTLHEMIRDTLQEKMIEYPHHHYYVYRGRSPYAGSGVNVRRFQKMAYAQFYFQNPGRVIKGLRRSPDKIGYFRKNLLRGVRSVFFY